MSGSGSNRVWETVTFLRFPKYRVTVRREVTNQAGTHLQPIVMGPDPKVMAVVADLEDNLEPGSIVQALKQIDHVTSIEVLNNEDDGGIFYPDRR